MFLYPIGREFPVTSPTRNEHIALGRGIRLNMRPSPLPVVALAAQVSLDLGLNGRGGLGGVLAAAGTHGYVGVVGVD